MKVTVAISNIQQRPETYAVPTHFLWRLFTVLMFRAVLRSFLNIDPLRDNVM